MCHATPKYLLVRSRFYLPLMSCPVTQVKNASQHPGLVDVNRKQRTSEQKRQDDAQIEQEKKKQQAAQALAIQWVADITTKETEAEENQLTGRRAQPRPMSSQKPVETSGKYGFKCFMRLTTNSSLIDPDDTIEDAEGEASEVVKGKKRHGQKKGTRDLVEAARKASHQSPGNSVTMLVTPCLLPSECFCSLKLSFFTGTISLAL